MLVWALDGPPPPPYAFTKTANCALMPVRCNMKYASIKKYTCDHYPCALAHTRETSVCGPLRQSRRLRSAEPASPGTGPQGPPGRSNDGSGAIRAGCEQGSDSHHEEGLAHAGWQAPRWLWDRGPGVACQLGRQPTQEGSMEWGARSRKVVQQRERAFSTGQGSGSCFDGGGQRTYSTTSGRCAV